MLHMLIPTIVITAATSLAMVTPAGRRLLARGKRAASILQRDPRVPRWYGWTLLVLFTFPIPGELDELLGVLLLAVTWPFCGCAIREAWSAAAAPVLAPAVA